MTRRLTITFLAAALLVAAFPLAVSAQVDEPATELHRSEEHLAKAKEHVIEQINRRLVALDRMADKVSGEEHITTDHASSLLAHYETAGEVLVAGISDVAAAQSLDELRDVARPIIENTLVFALQRPRTRAVNASDHAEVTGERHEELAAKLQNALDGLAEAGVDIAEPQADLDAAIELLTAAVATASPVAETVIDLTPGDDFAGPLADARGSLEEARSKLAEARELARGVARFIRESNQTEEV